MERRVATLMGFDEKEKVALPITSTTACAASLCLFPSEDAVPPALLSPLSSQAHGVDTCSLFDLICGV